MADKRKDAQYAMPERKNKKFFREKIGRVFNFNMVLHAHSVVGSEI